MGQVGDADQFKRAMEGIQQGLNASDDPVERFWRFERRRTARSRLGAGLVAVLIFLAGIAFVARAFVFSTHTLPAASQGGTAPGTAPGLVQVSASGGSPCPAASPGEYDPSLSPTSGPAGSVITITENVSTWDESGNYVPPSGHVQFWWNLDPGSWETVLSAALSSSSPTPAPSPFAPGDVQLLGSEDVTGLCSYAVQLTVPQVAPGNYPVQLVWVGAGGGEDWGAVTFSVT
jgi:hypothetical protein